MGNGETQVRNGSAVLDLGVAACSLLPAHIVLLLHMHIKDDKVEKGSRVVTFDWELFSR